MKPRVAFLGNVANAHFRAALALREAGVDAHVFVDRKAPAASRPENDLPAGAELPDWVHDGAWITPASVLAPRFALVTRALSRFDAVVASGPGPIFAQFCGRPWCFFVTGGDLTVKPFPFEFWDWYPTWRHRGAEVVAGAWQRRAARRADRVWLQPFAPVVDAADALGIPLDRRSHRQLPIVVDATMFAPDPPVTPAARQFAADATRDADLVIFHPSRLVLDTAPKLVRTGQWKGNDLLLRGVAEWLRRRPDRRPAVLLPDTALTRDVEQARALVTELGLEQVVRWIRPPQGDYFDRMGMAALYAAADVVVDEFGVGWFGFVTLEGLASGTPVLGHVDEQVMAQLYPSHPIVEAGDATQVADELERLTADPVARAELGRLGRTWVLEHHSPEAAARVYREAIDELR